MPAATTYYFCTSYSPIDNAASVRAVAIANAINGAGKNVKVVTHKNALSTHHIPIVKLPAADCLGNPNIFYRLLVEIHFSFCAFLYALFVPRHSIILISSPSFILSFIFILLPRKRGVRFVLDVRDLYPDIYIDSGLLTSRGILGQFLHLLERLIYQRCDLIFTVCKSMATEICQRSPKSCVKVVMNGFNSLSETVNIETQIRNDKLIIVSHGNFGQVQDTNLLLELIEKTMTLPFEYWLVGKGRDLNKFSKMQNVNIFGQVPHSEIPRILSKADIGISFRKPHFTGINGFPVRVFEFIGAGLHSIVVPKMPDLNEAEVEGFLKQFTGDQIENIIDYLSYLHHHREQLYFIQQKNKNNRNKYSRLEQSKLAAQMLSSLE